MKSRALRDHFISCKPALVQFLGLIALTLLAGSCGQAGDVRPEDHPPGSLGPSDSEAVSKLAADSPVPFERFGDAVSVHHGSILVGAPGNDEGAFEGGAAYYFSLQGDSWLQGQKLVPPEQRDLALFGQAVAVGERFAAVGAPFDSRDADRAGVVYLYRRRASGWRLESELRLDQAIPRTYFGSTLALSDETLVVGAPGPNGQAAYAYRLGASPPSVEKLSAGSGVGGDEAWSFGNRVAIDGDTIAVSGYLEGGLSPERQPTRTPFVRLFELGEEGWQPSALIEGRVQVAYSSASLALDRGLLALGLPGSGEGGHVDIYEHVSPGTWSLLRTYPAPLSPETGFGHAVAFHGALLAVGAPSSPAAGSSVADGNVRPGLVHLYQWGQSTPLPLACLGPTMHEGVDQSFGNSLASDGGYLVAGAIGDASEETPAGAVYVYEIAGSEGQAGLTASQLDSIGCGR